MQGVRITKRDGGYFWTLKSIVINRRYSDTCQTAAIQHPLIYLSPPLYHHHHRIACRQIEHKCWYSLLRWEQWRCTTIQNISGFPVLIVIHAWPESELQYAMITQRSEKSKSGTQVCRITLASNLVAWYPIIDVFLCKEIQAYWLFTHMHPPPLSSLSTLLHYDSWRNLHITLDHASNLYLLLLHQSSMYITSSICVYINKPSYSSHPRATAIESASCNPSCVVVYVYWSEKRYYYAITRTNQDKQGCLEKISLIDRQKKGVDKERDKRLGLECAVLKINDV